MSKRCASPQAHGSVTPLSLPVDIGGATHRGSHGSRPVNAPEADAGVRAVEPAGAEVAAGSPDPRPCADGVIGERPAGQEMPHMMRSKRAQKVQACLD